MAYTPMNIFGELERLLKEQSVKRDEYKKNLDFNKIRGAIHSFDVEDYKTRLTDYAASQNVNMTWADESYSGGWDGN